MVVYEYYKDSKPSRFNELVQYAVTAIESAIKNAVGDLEGFKISYTPPSVSSNDSYVHKAGVIFNIYTKVVNCRLIVDISTVAAGNSYSICFPTFTIHSGPQSSWLNLDEIELILRNEIRRSTE